MIISIDKSKLYGEAYLPSSKSVAARYLFASIFLNKNIKFIGFGLSEDIKAYFEAVKKIKPNSGIKVFNDNTDNIEGSRFEIEIDKDITEILFSKSSNPVLTFDCKDSAFCLRALSIILSSFAAKTFITGSKQLLKRPFGMIFDAIRQGGASIKFLKKENGFLVEGRLKSSIFKLNTKITTQHISGLIITLSFIKGESQIFVKNYHNGSFIDLTINILKEFGIAINRQILSKDYKKKYYIEKYKISGANNLTLDFDDKPISIESDWSSACFFMVAAALSGPITFYNLNINSAQPDSKIIDILKIVGADIEGAAIKVDNFYMEKNLKNDSKDKITDKITIRKKKLFPFEFDISDCPDIFPSISVLAVFCDGVSKIKGIKRLKYKESDRIKSIYKNFSKLGIKMKLKNDCFTIYGSSNYFSNFSYNQNNQPKYDKNNYILLDSFNDHRIFMALCILACFFNKDIKIEDNQSYKKSYPEFIETLRKLNCKFSIN